MKDDEKTGIAITAEALAPVQKHLAEHKGSVQRLADYLSVRLEKPIARQQITRWLNDEIALRIEPRYSVGLLMLEWLKLDAKEQAALAKKAAAAAAK